MFWRLESAFAIFDRLPLPNGIVPLLELFPLLEKVVPLPNRFFSAWTFWAQARSPARQTGTRWDGDEFHVGMLILKWCQLIEKFKLWIEESLLEYIMESHFLHRITPSCCMPVVEFLHTGPFTKHKAALGGLKDALSDGWRYSLKRELKGSLTRLNSFPISFTEHRHVKYCNSGDIGMIRMDACSLPKEETEAVGTLFSPSHVLLARLRFPFFTMCSRSGRVDPHTKWRRDQNHSFPLGAQPLTCFFVSLCCSMG